ncbi:MAG: hypothetical protein FWH43_03680, partial [Endomicrobia bacterium]|nr:hypothetical protein [Endomicrobiia bacterium]
MKKIIISLILIVFFCSISAAQTTVAVSSGPGFDAAIVSTNTAVINITVPSITLISDLAINGRILTINGVSSGSFVNLNNNRLLAVSGTNLTLSNLIIAGSASYAYSGYGAGLYATGSAVSFNNVTFQNNRAGTINQIHGGGFFVESPGASDMVTSSGYLNFLSNYAAFYGGGFYAGQNSTFNLNGTVNISSNSAYAGGGFYAYRTRMTFGGHADFIANGNTSGYALAGASTGGAGFYADRSTITFTATANFTGNTANRGSGGGFYAASSSITFSSAVFHTNVSSGSGGGFYLSNSRLAFTGGSVNITSNTAWSGGGFYASSSIVSFNSQAAISNNTAISGGAVYNTDNSIMTFRNGDIMLIGNSANFYGGAVWNANSRINFEMSTVTFSGNTAIYGGAVYNINNSTITFTAAAVTFSGNMADEGGAIYNSFADLSFTNSFVRFENNVSTLPSGGSGALCNYYGNISFADSNVIFSGNTADLGGGGAIINVSGTASFLRNAVTFNGNTAASGGAIINGLSSTMTFTNNNATFSGNTASAGGAVYNAYSGTISFFGSTVTFSSNTANYGYGGAIANEEDSIISFTSSSVSFKDNSAIGSAGLSYGGAIYNSTATISFTGSAVIFSSNNATNYGGAITNINNSTLTFRNGDIMFIGNSANYYGGAICNVDSQINFDTAFGSTVIFSNNYAASGRDIYNTGIINITGAGNIIFGGGIEGSGTINKSGTGKAHFEAGSKTDFAGQFNVTGGNVHFSTSAKISIMNIESAGTLTLDADFIGSLTSVLCFNGITINTADSKLYINNISTAMVNGTVNRAIFYANTVNGTFGDNNLYDAVTGSTASYTFVWQPGSYNINGTVYSHMGLLTYDNMGPWNTFAAAYKAVTSGNTIDLMKDITAAADDEDAFGLPEDDNIIINGNGYTLDSAGKDGLGFVFNGSSAIFKDISFTNFTKVFGSGGAILANNSAISLENTILFSNNTANYGGALYINRSTASFSGDFTKFTGNKAANSGGAIYVYGGFAEFNNASFADNSAGGKGGAVYVESLSNVISVVHFYSNNSNGTVFENNTAANADSGNGLYAGSNSEIHFITDYNASVEMRDSIAGSADNAKIFIEGEGDFNLYADSLNNHADIYLSSGGDFNFNNGASLSAGVFEYGTGTTVNMNDGLQNKLYVKDLKADGTLKMDLISGDAGDKIYVDGTASLGSSPELITNISAANFRKQIFTLINYSDLEGIFSAYDIINISSGVYVSSYSLQYDYLLEDKKWIVLMIYGDNLQTYLSKLEGITFNQKQTAGVYDALSAYSSGDLDYIIAKIEGLDEAAQRMALSQAAGYFLANVIRSGGTGSGSDEIYDRIKEKDAVEARTYDNKGIWIRGKVNAVSNKGDENSLNDYTDTSIGAMAGYDFYFANTDVILGLYGRADKHSIKQDPGNSADVVNAGLGLYGGYVKNLWDIKWLLSGSIDSYDTERYIPFAGRNAAASFGGMTLNIDIEAGIKMAFGENTMLRYYAGAEMRNSAYDEIKESGAHSLNLTVFEDAYQRSAARTGLTVNYEQKAYTLYAGGEYKYLIDGNLPELKNKFEEETNTAFYIRGSEEGKSVLGAKTGVTVNAAENVKLFANASYHTAERYSNIYGNIGVRIFFAPSEDRSASVAALANAQRAEEERKNLEAEMKAAEKEKNDFTDEEKSAAQKQSKLEAKQKKKEKAKIAAYEAKLAKDEKKAQAEAKKKSDKEAKIIKSTKKQAKKIKKQDAAEAKKKADEEAKAAKLSRRQSKPEEKEEKKKADEEAKAEALIKKQAEKDEKKTLAEAKKRADEETKAAELARRQTEAEE